MCCYHSAERIAIITANEHTLAPMSELIKQECGIDTQDHRFYNIGAQNVPGFEAVALG